LVAEGPGGYAGDDVGWDLVGDAWNGGDVVGAVSVVRKDDSVSASEGGLRGCVYAHLRHHAADGERADAGGDQDLSERRRVESVIPRLPEHVLARSGLDRQVQLPAGSLRFVVSAGWPVVLQMYDDRTGGPGAMASSSRVW
jgi:hypothetical protein